MGKYTYYTEKIVIIAVVLGLNGGRIIQGRIIPSNTVSYDE